MESPLRKLTHSQPLTPWHSPRLDEIDGLNPFPAWSLVGRYDLRWRDFTAGVEQTEERSELIIGPHFQLLMDAEDGTARMFGYRGTAEACQLVRDTLARYVKIND